MDQSALNYDPIANEDCCCQYPEEEAIAQITGCNDSTAINFNSNATVACDGCCNYTGCMDENALNYNPKATIACEDCCEYAPQSSVTDITQNDSISVVPTLAYKPLELPALPRFEASKWNWILDHKFLLSWILTGVLLAIALVVFLWKHARSRYIARRSVGEEPPYQLPIRISQNRPIAVDEDFYLALNQLRGREISARQLLDIPQTIRATLKQGGLIDFQYRHLTQSVEYLILIDKHNNQDHQAQLFEHIYHYFVRHEIYANRYFFDGDPTYCWNESHPSGIALERLVQLYQHARLLVLSDGHSFINPSSGELEPSVNALSEWGQRILLTPSPTASWDYREAILGKFFSVLPSNVEGMMSIIQHFEELPTPSLRAWKYHIGKKDEQIYVDDADPLITLKAYFPQEVMQWIAACALYPELHWDLSLEIGYSLQTASGTLVNFQNVRRMARLEWFQQGYIPNEIRQQLIDDVLTRENEEKARLAIILILEQNIPHNQQSYAYEQHQLHLAANQLLVSQLPEERRKWLEKYREQHAKRIGEDSVTVKALDQHFNRYLDFELPKTFRKFFYPEGRMVLGSRKWTPFVFAGILATLLWGISALLPTSCVGNKAQLPFGKDLYCLADARDSLAFFAHEVKIHLDSLRVEEAQNRVQEVDSLFAAHPLLDTFTRQVQTAQWNRALSFYNLGGYNNMLTMLDASLRSEQMQPQLQREFQHLRGLGYLYADNDSTAQSIATNLAPYAADLVHPGLLELTTYDFVDSLINERIRVRLDGKYGFLDETGRALWNGDLLPYDHATNYLRDSALVKINGQQCFVDLQENRLDCFNESSQVQERTLARRGTTGIERFLNSDSQPYSYYYPVRNNRIRIIEKGKFGFLDNQGNPTWEGDAPPYDYAFDFVADSALITIGNRQCFIDTSGNELSCYQQLVPFQDKQNLLWGYQNENGSVIIKPKYLSAGAFRDGQPALVQKRENSKYNYIDKYGLFISTREFEAARNFDNGLAIVQIINKWGAVNINGVLEIQIEYDEFSDFRDGLAQVQKNGRTFSINTLGECVGENCPKGLQVYGLNAENGTPLSNITIELFEVTEDGLEVRIESTTNNVSNQFIFDIDYNKKFRVKATRPGYLPIEEDFVFTPAEVEETNGNCLREIRFYRKPPWDFLPLAVYFDHNEPDPGNVNPITTKKYIETNIAYYEKRDTFIKEFTEGMNDNGKLLTSQRMIDFFDREVLGGRLELVAFSEELLTYLRDGNAIMISLKGYASPRGEPTYNRMLAARRINSVQNHFTSYNDGAFLPYIRIGQFRVNVEALGESTADLSQVSDDKDDDKGAIYSIIGSLERRVEITNITIDEKNEE